MKNTTRTNLYSLLKQDPRLWDEEREDFNETLLKELIDKLDKNLLQLLLSDKEIKDKFFIAINNIFVLKQNELKFFIDENTIDNSYTQYKNKIGLRVGKNLLSERNEVVLDWPYKDCVLEGGMTKEDQCRNEVFFNEVLGKDEIDRLIDPKVLVNWKRYATEGEEKVKEFRRDEEGRIQENLIIKGNNLLALHTIRDQFYGQIKLIYIDPPYNRDEDKTTFYNDKFNHSTWLTFMKNRLVVAKQLLSEDGVLFVQCDDNEQAYLKVLMDEIFSPENFLSTIAYQRSGVAGLGQGGKFVVNVTEYINVFAKNKSNFKSYDLQSEVPLELKHMKRYNAVLRDEGTKELFNEFTSKATGEKVKIFKHKNFVIEKISLAKFDERKDEIFEIYKKNFPSVFRLNVPQNENTFQWDIINSFDDDGLFTVEYLVSRGKNKGETVTNYYHKKQLFAWLKNSGNETADSLIKTNKMSDFWTNDEIPKADLANEGGVRLRRGKKPEQLLKRIISISTKEGDIVLDYHLGSGTTCAVAHKMGRRYIGIEQLDYEENDSVIRLNNVIRGDQTGISKYVGWQGGGDFIHVELAKWNEKAKEKILKAIDLPELISLFNEMYEQYFLNYNVKTKDFVEKTIQEDAFERLSLEEQKRLFVEMLDMNQMYVNFSERADSKYNISQEDIELSEKFFNTKG